MSFTTVMLQMLYFYAHFDCISFFKQDKEIMRVDMLRDKYVNLSAFY